MRKNRTSPGTPTIEIVIMIGASICIAGSVIFLSLWLIKGGVV